MDNYTIRMDSHEIATALGENGLGHLKKTLESSPCDHVDQQRPFATGKHIIKIHVFGFSS
jgi:hypothetical protein